MNIPLALILRSLGQRSTPSSRAGDLSSRERMRHPRRDVEPRAKASKAHGRLQ